MKEDNDMKQKNMELCRVRQGEAFTFDGVRFVKLDESAGAAFVVAEDVMLENIPFEHEDAEREDHNNYIGSNLERESVSWLMKEHTATFGAAVQRPIDLTTMDGMTDYGMPTVTVRALTIDEYRKYRKFIPLASKPYWLATGWTTKSSPYSGANFAYYAHTDGALDNDSVCYASFAARPALYLKSSILVSVDTEDEEKVLTDYSDSELIDELYRRRRATYDPD